MCFMVLSFRHFEKNRQAQLLPSTRITRERSAERAIKRRSFLSTDYTELHRLFFCIGGICVICGYYLINFPSSRQVMSLIWFSSRSLRKASLVKNSKSRWRQAAPQLG